MQQIIATGNDYLVAVKGNQPKLLLALESAFEQQPPLSVESQQERTRDRQTERCVSVLVLSIKLDPAWVGVERVWDIATGHCTKTLLGQIGWVRSVAFSPDGQFLAAGGIAPMVKVWDAKTGASTRTLLGHEDQVWAIAFRSDNILASAGADKVIRLWDVTTGECLQTLTGHTDWIYAIAPPSSAVPEQTDLQQTL